tara:strand:+ start:33272 stop:33958 length:687 start_codon:yes stop_codon:yes gene_type:complete
MKIKLILISFICVSSNTFAQRLLSEEKRQEYKSYSYENNQIIDIFSDSFNNGNVNNWNMGVSGESKGKIKNGSYFYTANWSSKENFTYQEIDFDTSKDFQIEITIRPETKNKFIKIRFGANGISNHQFLYKSDSEYRITEFNNEFGSKRSYIGPWYSGKGIINPGTSNKITIRHIDNGFYFFVNGVFLQKKIYIKALPWYGSKIGFVVDNFSRENTNSISEFKVSYLK